MELVLLTRLSVSSGWCFRHEPFASVALLREAIKEAPKQLSSVFGSFEELPSWFPCKCFQVMSLCGEHC